ncbi:hypothetical protein ACFPM3_20140 [Streptomyces coeruleoprunus]|uniref:Uncharacterized protein n=1 Tax=Streptomyces coeruleoprunus TaxID=285563 RepID=A0ABV9XLM0_9ACTN
MAFQYQQSTLDQYTAYVVEQLKAGRGVEISFDPHDGTFTGIVGIESGTEFALWVAGRAERRASTLNTTRRTDA